MVESGAADFRPLYPDDLGLWEKIETIARDIYGALETRRLRNACGGIRGAQPPAAWNRDKVATGQQVG